MVAVYALSAAGSVDGRYGNRLRGFWAVKFHPNNSSKGSYPLSDRGHRSENMIPLLSQKSNTKSSVPIPHDLGSKLS